MEYTVHKLAKLAGISARTLRYYDEIGILKPARITPAGYRIYNEKELDKLQQILFYRELGVSLKDIKNIITSPVFDNKSALIQHRKKLLERREQLDILIANIDKTVEAKEGRIKMSNKEKFEGFKQRIIDENEKRYGKEIREKYGYIEVNKSNEKIKNMTEEEYNNIEKLANDIMVTLKKAFLTGDPSGKLAQEAADLHGKWLSFYWGKYTKEAHAGIAQMYVDDARFTSYYDKEQPGMAQFLRDAILIYIEAKK